jgi:hypothetical protein
MIADSDVQIDEKTIDVGEHAVSSLQRVAHLVTAATRKIQGSARLIWNAICTFCLHIAAGYWSPPLEVIRES